MCPFNNTITAEPLEIWVTLDDEHTFIIFKSLPILKTVKVDTAHLQNKGLSRRKLCYNNLVYLQYM